MQVNKKSIIILDTNAFISCNNLINLSLQNRLITTNKIIAQIKDQKTLQKIHSLPIDIEIIQPLKKSLDVVKEFARKTGDIGSLSNVDLQLIALTYQLYIQNGFQPEIRKNPGEILQGSIDEDSSQNQSSEQDNIVQKLDKVQDKDNDDDGWIQIKQKKTKKADSSDQDLDDDQGWITPSNYNSKINQVNTIVSTKQQQKQEKHFVSLMSTDYAIQNVATQMGLKLLSFDGRIISQIRRFVWQCYLCWKQCKVEENTIKLCPNCGYNSLSKISYSIDKNGKITLHYKKGWKPNPNILEWKQKKLQQQQKKKKHQHGRRKKKQSIFDTVY